MKTYLIARAKIEDRSNKRGIDSIINLAYMGASEYEWGAMPTSLSNIRKNLNEYIYLDVKIKDQIVTVFCKDSQKLDVKKYLQEIASGKMNTKNGNNFDWYIKNNEERTLCVRNRVDFWWDIENDLMFWIKSTDFEVKFKEKIYNF